MATVVTTFNELLNGKYPIKLIGNDDDGYALATTADGGGNPLPSTSGKPEGSVLANASGSPAWNAFTVPASNGSAGQVLKATGTAGATAWGEPLGAAPASATSAGRAGQIAFDSGFLYVCISTNVWKRVAIATWP